MKTIPLTITDISDNERIDRRAAEIRRNMRRMRDPAYVLAKAEIESEGRRFNQYEPRTKS